MRKEFLFFSILIVILGVFLGFIYFPLFGLFFLIIPILILGFYDYFQVKHTIRRNFPLLGRFRYLAEKMRPGIQQYFVESDINGTPFNRTQRSLIYSRSKNEMDTRPFGTLQNVYETGYEWANHSIHALDHHTLDMNPKVKIGSSQCTQPYNASIFNISAMSFGSLSQNAILALNQGAKLGGFYHNTGEGGLSPYHLEGGGDITWNIGTGYFSCRNTDGTFNESEFEKRALLPNVKMIEIKFSQGAKPGHGGILPKEKLTKEISEIRLVPMGEDVVSPPYHKAFKTPKELMTFVQKLRTLSQGKPIGIKICIGHKSEFLSICKAMVETQTYLDFITVDGGEGGTGAAPLEFTNSVGMPLRDAIAFVYDALKGFGLKEQIKIICSGKIHSGFDIIKVLSLGGDVCNSARGMMFALGCIQALECNSNTCPTGIATQDPELVAGLNVNDKKVRVFNFHKKTVTSAVEIMAAAGLNHPDLITRRIVYRRVDATKIETYEETYPEIEKGSLLKKETIPLKYINDWNLANTDRF